jgi:molybdate transport system substrate-binding protein
MTMTRSEREETIVERGVRCPTPLALLASLLIALLAGVWSAAASAQEGKLVVFAAASLKDALDEVNTVYRHDKGQEITTSYAASPT